MGERLFQIKEVAKIISNAGVLQELNKERDNSLETRILDLSGDRSVFTSEDILKIAEDMKIGQEQVRKVLEICFPSRNKILDDLNKLGAKADVKVKAQVYFDELKRVLYSNLPAEIIRMKLEEDYTEYNLSIKRFNGLKEVKRFLRKPKKVEDLSNLAFLNFNCDSATTLHLYDPIFLRAAGEKLQELRELFKDQVSAKYYYIL